MEEDVEPVVGGGGGKQRAGLRPQLVGKRAGRTAAGRSRLRRRVSQGKFVAGHKASGSVRAAAGLADLQP